MKKAFKSYYKPTEEEFAKLWNNCLFVLDANVLLNLYKYSPDTYQELIKIFREISNRLWIPHQVAYEYHKNRRKVISDQIKIYDEFCIKLKNIEDDIRSNFQKFNEKYKKHSYLNTNELQNKLFKELKELIKNVEKQKQEHPKLEEKDFILDTITEIFTGKTGVKYQKDKINEIYKEGKRRYDLLIPPGYLDNKKNEIEKYGDLVLWFQIIDKAKEIKKPIIFITDEGKDDWWFKIDTRTIGPKPELIEEMNEKGNADFYIYQTDNFMKYMRDILRKHIEEKAISEVKEIRKIDEFKLKTARESPFLKFENEVSQMAASSAFTEMIGAFKNYDKIYPGHFINALNNAMNSHAASSSFTEMIDAYKNCEKLIGLNNNKEIEKLIGINNYLGLSSESTSKSNENNDDNQKKENK